MKAEAEADRDAGQDTKMKAVAAVAFADVGRRRALAAVAEGDNVVAVVVENCHTEDKMNRKNKRKVEGTAAAVGNTKAEEETGLAFVVVAVAACHKKEGRKEDVLEEEKMKEKMNKIAQQKTERKEKQKEEQDMGRDPWEGRKRKENKRDTLRKQQ